MCAAKVVTIALSLAEARDEISARQLDVLGAGEGGVPGHEVAG